MAKPYKRKGSKFWYVAPWIGKKQVPQSTKTTNYEAALRRLKILEGKIAGGAPIQAKTDRGTFTELLELVRTDYKVKERATIADAERRIDKHLSPMLGHYPAGKVTTQLINEYIVSRRQAKAKHATVNRELAVIKRAFHLGEQQGLISYRPHIDMLPEDNVRQGFFIESSFRSVMAKASPLLQDVLIMAYYTGWRSESILTFEWSRVDFEERCLRGFQTKNRKQTFLPLEPFPELENMLKRRDEERRKAGLVIPYVFHRNGEPVKSVRKAWVSARKKAGLPGRWQHDFRRSAVRSLKRLGFSDTEVMSIVGLKTLSMLIRYNITTEEDISLKAKLIAKAQNA